MELIQEIQFIPQHLLHGLSTVFGGLIVWAFSNFANSSFSILVHAIIIGEAINDIILVITHDQLTHFSWSRELFPQNIIIVSNIL